MFGKVIDNFLGITGNAQPKVPTKVPKKTGYNVVPPSGRSSVPDVSYNDIVTSFQDIELLKPGFQFDIIPVIRKLFIVNQNVSLAMWDMVELINTGHRIIFDKGVSSDQVDSMRLHLESRSKEWNPYMAGTHGLVNRLIAQLFIGGAISYEIVVDNKKQGIDYITLLNPENIRFRLEKSGKYSPYQYISNKLNKLGEDEYIRLNTLTYKYTGLLTDVDIPYGIPPFISALEDLGTQRNMIKNLNYIIEEFGLLGFFEILLSKPDRLDSETPEQYNARLNTLLDTAKANVKSGMKDGTIAGYSGDHTFKFNTIAKNTSGADSLFSLNQKLVSNGLKFPPNFMGAGDQASQVAVGIVFTKMLSQLNNVQEILIDSLKHIYNTELRLAGFNYNYLGIEFNKSTLTDEVKFQQSREYKVRTLMNLYDQGIISQETFADELGYEKPDTKEPRVSRETPSNDTGKGGSSKSTPTGSGEVRRTTERRKRDKDTNQPKRSDTKTEKR